MGLAYNPKIVTDGLVLYLDAANPKSYPGTGLKWFDLSGKNNHATLTGTSSFVTYNSAGYFSHNPGNVYFGAASDTANATATYGAHWNIPSDASLAPNLGWTVSGFMRVLGGQSGNGSGWFVQSGTDQAIHLEPIGNTFRANASGAGWSLIDYGIAAYHNIFAHYTFVYTQSSGVYGTNPGLITLYVNGNFAAANASFTPTARTNYQIDLGRRQGHLYHYMKADVSSYQFYTRSLTSAEVSQNFNALKGRYGI